MEELHCLSLEDQEVEMIQADADSRGYDHKSAQGRRAGHRLTESSQAQS